MGNIFGIIAGEKSINESKDDGNDYANRNEFPIIIIG